MVAPWSDDHRWQDLLSALDFAQNQFAQWTLTGVIGAEQHERIAEHYRIQREQVEDLWRQGQAFPSDSGLARPTPGESELARKGRYLMFVRQNVKQLYQAGHLSLAQFHTLARLINDWLAAISHQLAREARHRSVGPEPIPVVEAIPVVEVVASEPGEDEERAPRRTRNLLALLLEPHTIQALLGLGGALIVGGIVLLLWINELLTPPMVAIGLGVINGAVLVAGWLLLRFTVYRLAGRALTLLACLVMPLNLWYYHTNGLITLDQHLWVPALVMCGLYAISAIVVEDEWFVYILCAGITLTGLLFLADLPPSPQRFWEIALPASMLTVLGLLAIHVERLFPDIEGPFGRRRFGKAFLRCGHLQLLAALLLILGAQIAGKWLYEPFFKPWYEQWQAKPSPIVNELRWLALTLVLLGVYAYAYTGIILGQGMMYISASAACLVWSLILILDLFDIVLGRELIISVLAFVSIGLHLAQRLGLKEERLSTLAGLVGWLLPAFGLCLGLVVYLRALSPDLRSVWNLGDPPSWNYVLAIALTAAAFRVGAWAVESVNRDLSTLHYLGYVSSTLLGATALLAALGLQNWEEHAPLLMLLPIGYLIAARLYQGTVREKPILIASHIAAVIMLVSSVKSAFEGFEATAGQQLNLSLAAFFAEAMIFYILAAAFYGPSIFVYCAAAAASLSVWQLTKYWKVTDLNYALALASAGLVFLVSYRLAWPEQLGLRRFAEASFQVANLLLSLAFVAASLMTLRDLAGNKDKVERWYAAFLAALSGISLLSVALVAHPGWRRWYVVTTVGQAALAFLVLAVLAVLTPLQQLEVFCVIVGLIFLVAAHIGWYYEHDRHDDLVTVGLFIGSILLVVPLTIATLVDRYRNEFLFLNEFGWFLASIALIASGYILQLRITTLVGAASIALYFGSMLIFVPWASLNAIAWFVLVVGSTLFILGLGLGVFRDHLLALPEMVRQRRGIFRVLDWR
ncbi:MAG: hypothetical protein RMJ82_03020 [Gemmatales bacterium]|nr:hypothetical protein [Gemmatales bacterium]